MSALFPQGLVALDTPVAPGASRHLIPSGDAGTAETIAGMQRMVDAYKRHPRIRELAGSLIHVCPKKDWYCYAKAIFDFCQNKIQYAYDPHGVEWVESPLRILDAKIADCDSICVLFAALCENIGLVCRYVTIRADKGRSNEFSHVYAQVKIPNKGWVSADCTMQHKFGWEPVGYEAKHWPASSTPASEGEMDGMDCHYDGAPMHGLNGMRDFNAEAFDPLETTENEVEVSAICEECAPIKASMPEQSGMFIRQAPQQNYLSGLGAVSDQNTAAMLSDMLSGELGRELVALRNEQRDRVGPLFTAIRDAKTSSRKNLLQSAFNLNQKGLVKTNEAIQKYNEIATKIQTFTFGAIKPGQLSGLGIVPAAITPGLVLAVGAALYALAELVRAARSTETQTKGLLEQAGGVVDATGNLVRNLSIAAFVGVGLYFAIPFLKKLRSGGAA